MVFEKDHLQTIGQNGLRDLFPESSPCRGSEEEAKKKDKQNSLPSQS
jgi:hypothetical protein